MNIVSERISRSVFAVVLCTYLVSCSVQKQISKQANKSILQNTQFSSAHVGIVIFDPKSSKYIYNHQGHKMFVPASNVKLFSLYAGLKYLGDSIIGARYKTDNETLMVEAAGDPTFLHPDFKNQRLFDLMKEPRFERVELHTSFATSPLGKGWAWDDFTEDYMVERDPFPMYGNVATFTYKNDTLTTIPGRLPVAGKPVQGQSWSVTRNLGGHFFLIGNGRGTNAAKKSITLAMEKGAFASRYLADTLHKEVVDSDSPLPKLTSQPLYSQVTDSLFKVMMHRSDNFFAEQTLMMVSNELLGQMNEKRLIDTLVITDLKELPQKPKWVDGSGLSRYNLFSPQDFVWLLNKLDNAFGFDKLKTILPTGNSGTLKGLYKDYANQIYAKTGTLSNNVALSGYLVTKQKRKLIFSILVNHHQSTPGNIRTALEDFLTNMIAKY